MGKRWVGLPGFAGRHRVRWEVGAWQLLSDTGEVRLEEMYWYLYVACSSAKGLAKVFRILGRSVGPNKVQNLLESFSVLF